MQITNESLTSIAEGTALHQAGLNQSAGSSLFTWSSSSLLSSMAATTNVEVDTNANAASTIPTAPKPRKPNKRRRTETHETNMPLIVRRLAPKPPDFGTYDPVIPASQSQNFSFQIEVAAVAPHASPKPETAPESSTARKKMKSKSKPKTIPKAPSRWKVAKGNVPTTLESTGDPRIENDPAIAGVRTEEHDAKDEAPSELDEHRMGRHLGRDPYGLASMSYIERGLPVPWAVCELCEEEEKTTEMGFWNIC
jgi:hypothetical protein